MTSPNTKLFDNPRVHERGGMGWWGRVREEGDGGSVTYSAMYVRMYVCMYACMHVRMYVYTHIALIYISP